jgi:hypothetical protein
VSSRDVSTNASTNSTLLALGKRKLKKPICCVFRVRDQHFVDQHSKGFIQLCIFVA